MKPPGPTAPRQLTRSRSDRMLGGVAGGLAQTYGFDPALVRLAFVVLTLATAIGLEIWRFHHPA